MDIITNKNLKPTIEEIIKYVNNPLFNKFDKYFKDNYNVSGNVEYSGDNVLLGWNIKYTKSSKTLCRIYPRSGFIYVLIVIGRKEKEEVISLLSTYSKEFNDVYNNTNEGMEQKWLIFKLDNYNSLCDNILDVVRIRMEKK